MPCLQSRLLALLIIFDLAGLGHCIFLLEE
jgi:hypothetical protein